MRVKIAPISSLIKCLSLCKNFTEVYSQLFTCQQIFAGSDIELRNRQLSVIRINADKDLCRHITSLGQGELTYIVGQQGGTCIFQRKFFYVFKFVKYNKQISGFQSSYK